MVRILLLILILFCCLPSSHAASLLFSQSLFSNPSGTAIQPGDDAQLNSLVVSGTLQADSGGFGCAPSGVAGEIKAGKYMPCDDTSAVVVQPPSGSTSTDLFVINDETGGEQFSIDAAGNALVDGDVYTKSLTGAIHSNFIKPRNTSIDLVLQLNSDTKGFSGLNTAGGEVWRIDSAGMFNFADRLTLSTVGTGADVDVIQTFTGGTYTATLKLDDFQNQLESSINFEAPVLSALGLVSAGSYILCDDGYYGDTTSLPSEHPKGIIATDLLEYHDASAKRFEITTTAASASDVNVELTFTGGTNTGSMRLDDGANAFIFNKGLSSGGIIRAFNSSFVSKQGYYGDTITLPSEHPKGANYPAQTAPSAPSSGLTIYADSTTLEGTAKHSDGSLGDVGIRPSFGKIFEENEAGSTITVVTAGTYYPWITSETGMGTGSTGGDTITTSTGNPSSITIETKGEGFYFVAWHAGLEIEANSTVEGAVFKDTSRVLPLSNHIESTAGTTSSKPISASSIVYLIDGEVLTLQFTSDTDGDDVIVTHAALNAFRLSSGANL